MARSQLPAGKKKVGLKSMERRTPGREDFTRSMALRKETCFSAAWEVGATLVWKSCPHSEEDVKGEWQANLSEDDAKVSGHKHLNQIPLFKYSSGLTESYVRSQSGSLFGNLIMKFTYQLFIKWGKYVVISIDMK